MIPPSLRVRARLGVVGLRRYLYSGNQVFCPVCGGRFRRFLPFGRGAARRENAQCPSCHAVERTRLLMVYLSGQNKRVAPFLQGRKRLEAPSILHFAPEPGIQRRLRKALGDAYRTADLIWPLADDLVDIQRLPYRDASYELILVSHVLAHVENDRLALTELRRVISPDGELLLQEQVFAGQDDTRDVPSGASAEERLRITGHRSRYRTYGADLPDRLKESNFAVEIVDPAAAMTEKERVRFGLSSEHPEHPGVIFRCTPK